MIRAVRLPEQLRGRLYLRSMPGCHEPFESARHEIVQHGVDWVVCLNPLREVTLCSPEYAAAIEHGDLPWHQVLFPIPDFGVPAQPDDLLQLARTTARRIEAGESVLVHCYAGIGRTGTLACCVLLALGLPLEVALPAVGATGSRPESAAQMELVRWAATELP